MHVQDVDAAFFVGLVHQHLPVKAAGPQQGRVEDLGAVGGRQDDDARAGVKAVHLGQQLVEGLLFFIVPAQARKGPSCAAQCVEFVNEDDGRCRLAGLLEQVAHPRCAHTHKHLDKLAARHGKEGYTRFARHRFGQQGLAGAGRPHQQHAFRDVGAQATIVLGVFQKIHHLHQLLFGFVHPGHIRKVHARVVHHIDFGAALADVQKTTGALLAHHAADQEKPQPKKHQRGQDPRQHLAQPGAFDDSGVGHLISLKTLGQIGLHPHGKPACFVADGFFQPPYECLVRYDHLGDAAIGQGLLELAVGHGFAGGSALQQALHPQQEQGGHNGISQCPALFSVQAAAR